MNYILNTQTFITLYCIFSCSDKMKTNKQILEDYKADRSNDKNLSPNTIENQHVVLTKFGESVNKPFKAITKNDLKEYLTNYKPSSQDLRIVVTKKFYTWLYNGKIPEWIQTFKPRGQKAKDREGALIKGREKIITPEEYQKMLDACLRLEHKAILETLYIYGCRAGELVSMNATDIKEEDDMVTITIRESKTKIRDIPSKEDPQYLLDWYTTYQPYREQKDKPLWVTGCNRTQGQRLTKHGILTIIKRAKDRAGIKKNVTTHSFRHTAITRDRANGMPHSLLEVKYGWVHGSMMVRVYDHSATEELKNFLRGKVIHQRDTYRNLKRERETIIKKQQKEISELKNRMDLLAENLEIIMPHWTRYIQRDKMNPKEREKLKAELLSFKKGVKRMGTK